MNSRQLVRLFAICFFLFAVIGIARGEDNSSTTIAAKKSDAPKTTKKSPSHKIGRGVVVIYSAPRDPVSFNRKGEATFHPDMAKVMESVDLDKVVPAKVAVSSPKSEHFTFAAIAGE